MITSREVPNLTLRCLVAVVVRRRRRRRSLLVLCVPERVTCESIWALECSLALSTTYGSRPTNDGLRVVFIMRCGHCVSSRCRSFRHFVFCRHIRASNPLCLMRNEASMQATSIVVRMLRVNKAMHNADSIRLECHHCHSMPRCHKAKTNSTHTHT